MDSFEFSNSGGRVKIGWNLKDHVVTVDAKAYGFRGHADGPVELDAFKKFAKDIVKLAKARKGQATFSSAFPGFFDVTVRSIDGVGHLGVFGSLTAKSGTEFDEDQKLQFSLHFEPAQIESAARAMRRLAS